MKGVEYKGMTMVDGPIVVMKKTEDVFYGETVILRDRFGEKRTGRIIDISQEAARYAYQYYQKWLQFGSSQYTEYENKMLRLFKDVG